MACQSSHTGKHGSEEPNLWWSSMRSNCLDKTHLNKKGKGDEKKKFASLNETDDIQEEEDEFNED